MTRVTTFGAALAFFAAFLALAPSSSDAGELPASEDKIVYSCGFDFTLDICSMNPDGTGEEMLTDDPNTDDDPELSPNGQTIAWTKGGTEIWLMNPDGSNPRRMRDFGSFVADPTWSPNGDLMAFRCADQGTAAICTARSDGSTGQDGVAHMVVAQNPDWSPDGTRIAFEGIETVQGKSEIFVVTLATGQVTNLTDTPDHNEYLPRWSPDGTKLAIWGEALPGDPLSPAHYTMNANGSGRERLFSPMFFLPLSSAAWSPDGTMIAVFCDQLPTNLREMCIVDPADGDLIDVVEVTMGHASEGWSEPSWGSTGGTQQGDIDCNGSADPIDALKLLRFDAGLGASHNDPCLEVGDEVTINDALLAWGDVDCNGLINPVDALKVLRYDAGLEVQQEPGCPNMGEFVT